MKRGVEAFRALCEADPGPHLELIRDVVEQTLRMSPETEPPWGGYLSIDQGEQIVVGTCAFKGRPDGSGVVEIAYFTFPGFEGRGYASAAAATLVGVARSQAGVSRIRAHTLPERNASTRVLEKIGMSFIGSVEDPEDGLVWRWELPREA